MHVERFTGRYTDEVIEEYNAWAANKGLARDVIVHSVMIPNAMNLHLELNILVYFDEVLHPSWVRKEGGDATTK